MLKQLVWVFLLLFSVAVCAARVLPQNVQAGQLQGSAYPQVRIDSTVYRLAPGARIYDTSNRTIIPTSLPQGGKVLYQLDSSGMLIQMWLPTPDEAARTNP